MIPAANAAALIQLERAQREQLRWLMLCVLHAARPTGANEGLLLAAASDVRLIVSATMVRQELSALAKRGLVALHSAAPVWSAEISAAGEDVVDYRAECPTGIARPPQWQ